VFLDNVAACLPPDQAATVDRDLLGHSPRLASALERQARRDLAAGRVDVAVHTMREVVGRTPEDITAQTLLADALVAAHRPRDAASALAAAAAASEDPGPILDQEARAYAAAGDDAAMRRTVEQLRGLAGGSSHRLGAAMMLLGELEISRGNTARALRAYDEANRFDPTSDGLRRVASISEGLGDLRGAFRAYAELCENEGPGSTACVARDRLAGTGGSEPGLLPEQPMDPLRPLPGTDPTEP
jgi:tetratricopeptide (TPR) repeat protein